MKFFLRSLLLAIAIISTATAVIAANKIAAKAIPPIAPIVATADLEINSAQVSYLPDLDLLTFEQTVEGNIGSTLPIAVGQLDGAPVLGYVFPTTLQAEDVGFSATAGIVALAVTSHPDFDDTPLWDEDGDGVYDNANDGKILHTHWVILGEDARASGGFSVKEFKKEDASVILPPTNPGMPMYMDSPGFSVLIRGNTLKVLVPAARINNKTDFNYDAVAAYMQVNTSDNSRPLLGVYEVYSIGSGDLSLPYTVGR